MKKKDVIKLVKESIKEMRSFYGSHDNFQPTGQRRNLSGLPGVMEEEDFDAKAEYEDLTPEERKNILLFLVGIKKMILFYWIMIN